jgi:hypothetical protein
MKSLWRSLASHKMLNLQVLMSLLVIAQIIVRSGPPSGI